MTLLTRLICLAVFLLPVQGRCQFEFAELRAGTFQVFPSPAWVVALADVDRDGDLDAYVGYSWPGYDQNRLYLNDGHARFADVTSGRLPVDTDAVDDVAFGDLDGDGDVDLVVADTFFQSKLYLNNGVGFFSDTTASRFPPWTYGDHAAVRLGDVDGDGDLDIVFAPYLTLQGTPRLLINDGRGFFSDGSARLPAIFLRSRDVALADVDGDRDLDILLATTDLRMGALNRLWLNDGLGHFTDASHRLPGHLDHSYRLAVGDVDGDGDFDVVVGNGGNQVDRLYLNNGQGFFSDASTRLPGLSTEIGGLALSDVDLDNDLDIVIPSSLPQFAPNRLYLNDGRGNFTDASHRLPVDLESSFSLAVGDLDGDGDPDLIVGKDRGGQNRLLLNLQRQFDAPVPARVGQPYTLDLYAQPGFAPGPQVGLVWLSPRRLQPAVPIAPLGLFGLDPAGLLFLTALALPAPTGRASHVLPIPNDPFLRGSGIHGQALLLPSALPTDARLTNLTVDTIR